MASLFDMHAVVPARAATASHDPIVSVRLPRLGFLGAWCGVLALRCICAGYLMLLCLLYSVLATPELEYYARLLSPHSKTLFKPASWVAGVGAMAHWYQFCKVLCVSLRARRTTFVSTKRAATSRTRTRRCYQIPLLRRTMAVAERVRFELFGRQGFFGVESPYFEVRFLVREFIEMVSQTVQVYSASNLIAKQWINHLYVGAVFVNSFSTPLTKRFTRHSPALERLMCLTVDLSLDLVTSMAVPLMIAAPYCKAFNSDLYGFEAKLLYNPGWFINMVMENRQVFVRNHVDMALKVTPHMCVFGCLNSIQSLVRAQGSNSSAGDHERCRVTGKRVAPEETSATSPHSPPLPRAAGPRGAALVPARIKSRSYTRRLSLRISLMQRHKLQERKAMLVHYAFIAWGLVIVLAHLLANYAAYRKELCGCSLQLHPWFTKKCACSVFEYNCRLQGTASPREESFRDLDASTVLVVVFSHCPALVMPASIRQLSKLAGIEIWNSSIVAWGSDAGITSQSHPSMAYVCLVGSTMSGVPEGLLNDIPPELQDIEITHSNLSSLPEDLDVRWSHVTTLYLEYTQLSAWPEVLSRMAPSDLSLVGNNLRSLPTLTDDGAGNGYYTLSLSNNPLLTLPEYTGDAGDLMFLSLENTLIAELPSWIETVRRHGYSVYMYGTPFCASKSAGEIEAEYGADAVLTCVNSNPRFIGRYPFDEIAAQWLNA